MTNVSPIGNYDLTIRWDTDRLQADLAAIEEQAWTPHYSNGYRGEWSGLALHSASGSALQIADHEVDAAAFLGTALLEQTPYFRELLAFFQCRLKSVRLLKLDSNSSIHEHSDPSLGRGSGEVRIHIPIRTNPDVEFYVDGERLLLEEGQTYTVDVSRPHRVKNGSERARIHLVLDAEANSWLRELVGVARPIMQIAAPQRSFSAFRKLVVSSPELQRELSTSNDRDAFTEILLKKGHDRGFDFDRDDIEWHSVPTLDPPRTTLETNWAPVSVHYSGSTPFVNWIAMGTCGFTEPFYQDTISTVRRQAFSQAFRWKQPLEVLGAGRSPTGFIFHMSRCGSTLLCRMLAALDRATVISEAPPIDDVIEGASCIDGLAPEKHVAWLRSAIWALGRPFPERDLFFVKLDAWHIHKMPLIRLAFPEVPWVFLYRDPLEVLVSQARDPGRFALPGGMATSTLGLNPEDVVGLTREQWCARALAEFCRSALRFADNKGCFVNYRHLPRSLWSWLAGHFGISFTQAELETMQSATALHAKNPERQFHPDSEQKRNEATPALKELAGRELQSLYHELETHPQALR